MLLIELKEKEIYYKLLNLNKIFINYFKLEKFIETTILMNPKELINPKQYLGEINKIYFKKSHIHQPSI